MSLLLNITIFVVLILLGLFAGRRAETKHLLSIAQRQQELSGILVTQLRSFPQGVPGGNPPCLLVGEVVIATDYLKNFLAKLRGIFGGEVRSYQSLLSRARQEATLRIQAQARDLGYDAVCNLRMETADVGGNTSRRKVAMVAIIASGTAYRTSRLPT